MDEKQLVADLSKKFKMSDREFAPVWRELVERGRTEDFQSDETYTLKDLEDDVREIMDEQGTGAMRRWKAGRKPLRLQEHFEVRLSDYAKERAGALSDALALEAASFPAVREFRQGVLGGKLLSPEQVREFVTSPAVRFFRRKWFRKWDIPMVEHKARVVATHRDVPEFDSWRNAFKYGFDEAVHGFFAVHVDPPGLRKSVLYAHPQEVEVPEGLGVDEHYSVAAENVFERPVWENGLRYYFKERVRETWMLPWSLLDDLRGLVDLLGNRYGWSQEEGVQFVLTDKKPEIQPLKVGASLLTGHRGSPPVWNISLEVAPWVNPREVEEAYRGIQQQVLQGDSGRGHLSNKKLALYRFVKEQSRCQEEPRWHDLLERWNEDNEKRRYKETKVSSHRINNFKRDFRDAERKLLHPEYRFPQPKVVADLEEGQERELRDRRAAAEADSAITEARLNMMHEAIDD